MGKIFKKILLIAVVLLSSVSFFSLAACGGSDNYSPNRGSDGYYEYSEKALADNAERVIIYSADISVTVDDCEKTAETLKTKVVNEYADGYLDYESSRENSVYLSFRIPKDKLSDFVNFVKATGKVNSCVISSNDVTENYANVTNEMNYLLTYYEQLETMLEKANDANDFSNMLAISKEMQSVTEKLDHYQHVADGYLSRANLSTVTVDLQNENEYNAAGVWGNLGNILSDSFKSVGIVFGYLATVFVALIPYALIGLGITCVVFVIIGLVRKSKGKTFFIKGKREKDISDGNSEKDKNTTIKF